MNTDGNIHELKKYEYKKAQDERIAAKVEEATEALRKEYEQTKEEIASLNIIWGTITNHDECGARRIVTGLVQRLEKAKENSLCLDGWKSPITTALYLLNCAEDVLQEMDYELETLINGASNKEQELEEEIDEIIKRIEEEDV